MIRALRVGGDPAQHVARVVGGGKNHVLKRHDVHVMRAAERRQRAAGLEQLERAQMDFLVAAQRIGHGRAVARERRRIENDEIESRNDALVRFDGGVGLEPVENVHGLERTFFRQAVGGGVAGGRGDGIRALVEQMDMRRARARRVQAKPAEKTEAVQNLRVPCELRHGLIIHLLVEIHPGLVAANEVGVQILNQMKEAFTLAQEHHCTGTLMNRLFHTTFHVGKRARAETEIGEGAVSVSYAAAELASKIFGDLTKRTALLIGAGETGMLTAKHLTSRNLGTLLLTNRTRSRAEELVSQLGGRVVDFDRMTTELPLVDIVITSVEAPTHILSAGDIRQTMKQRGNKPLFIIDIGVPRNVDPAVNQIGNVFLHDIDALNHIIDQNLAHRKAEIPKIEQIIRDELEQFQVWHDGLQVTPTIQQLREQFELIRHEEVGKHLHHFPTDKQEEIEILTKRIVNKILHTPMVNLKTGDNESGNDETRAKVSIVRSLFGLDKKQRS